MHRLLLPVPLSRICAEGDHAKALEQPANIITRMIRLHYNPRPPRYFVLFLRYLIVMVKSESYIVSMFIVVCLWFGHLLAL